MGMSEELPPSDPPLPSGMDYTDKAYWQGSIKMSLSRFFVLAVISRRPMHAYGVVREVHSATGGCCSPGEGTVYPMLKSFEAGGYMTTATEMVNGRERKVYSLTPRGQAAFRSAISAWKDATACLLDSEAGEALSKDGVGGGCRACRD